MLTDIFLGTDQGDGDVFEYGKPQPIDFGFCNILVFDFLF